MRRTQISLDEPLYEALRRRAFEQRVSMAQVVREALAAYLASGEPPGVATSRGESAGTPQEQPPPGRGGPGQLQGQAEATDADG